ncbi:MAG: potassium channel family protein [Bacteroidia bacterium]
MPENNSQDKLGFLNLLVIFLSIYVLGAVLIETFYKLPHEIALLIQYIDFAICAIFFIEFCIRFYKADKKWEFMKWGWIDLVSSIPMIDYLRAGRLLRLIRLLRIVRAFRSTNLLIKHIFKNKAEGALASATISAILLILFSSIAILQVEHDPESNIKTAEDGIWWAYSTLTTVSYGELYPVTTEGRVIAAILMAAGIALFGTFTGFIASWFYKEKIEEEEEEILNK